MAKSGAPDRFFSVMMRRRSFGYKENVRLDDIFLGEYNIDRSGYDDSQLTRLYKLPKGHFDISRYNLVIESGGWNHIKIPLDQFVPLLIGQGDVVVIGQFDLCFQHLFPPITILV